ncbi:hypothetical protein PF919_004917 [Salmonella enterica]|nr:hypothetical protein [Salmonella enterica]ECC9077802.1 hypothetical protein [Salmonella enterica subsp. enterica]EIK9774889.1 hypothetical protein [Salmonella enterica]EIL4623215.1 hypothetical protein [Salmonella enterica]EKI7237716.1 hypothetical protein [Salmonella enterica]
MNKPEQLPEWRKALDKCVENYQSTRAWYEENRDSPAAEQDMDAAEGEIEKLIKQYGVLIVLSLMDEIDELQERRKADNADPAGYHVIKECGKVGCSVATLEEAEKTRDFWNKKWIIKPYFYAPPVQETGVYKDMLNIINLLENNEWAEHCTSTVLGSLLESEITRLVSKEQSAPVVPEEITDESTEQRLMGRRWAHSFCAGWNACRAAMLQSKYRDLSQPVDPQISEYEKIMLRAGWVMVPVEPTDEMIEAAMNCEDVLFNSDESFCVQFGNIYEAMLAAAPQPETSDGK